MPKKKLKARVIEHGKTLNSGQQFVERLSKRLVEVKTNDPCDVVLAICPIVSRVGTDINAAWKAFEGECPTRKPIILVVLHHTFDRDYVVPDCSRYVGDSLPLSLIVNGLFHEDHGLIKNCDVNSEAIRVTLEKLKEFQKKGHPFKNTCLHNPFRKSWKPKPKLKALVFETGKTLNSGQQFVERLSYRMETVMTENDCDIVFAVCPIVSRVGTDIEAAMKDKCSTTKPIILLVLHHTFDRDYVVPDCSRYVGDHVSFTANGLFHEDHGLLKNCDVNTEAIRHTLEKLKEFQKEKMKKDGQKQEKSPKKA